jgi:hypothetical protein
MIPHRRLRVETPRFRRVATPIFQPLKKQCCRLAAVEDSHRKFMRLDCSLKQAILRPKPQDEPVRLHFFGPHALVTSNLVGQGENLAREGGDTARWLVGVRQSGFDPRPRKGATPPRVAIRNGSNSFDPRPRESGDF